MKIRNGNGKFILKSLLEDYLPKQFFDRPKQGFGVPIDSWLRTDLREWAEDLLSEESLKKNDIFNTMPIRRYWSEHLSKRRNWQHEIWAVLMFQSWSRAHL